MTRSSVVFTVSPHHRVADEVRRRHRAIPGATPFTLRLPDGVETLIGEGEPDVTLVCTSRAGLDALSSFDLATAGEAYLAGDIDVEGDLASLLGMRAMFTDRHPVRYAARFVRPVLRGQVKSDHEYIAHHYEEDPAFFLAFLDRRHRAYSQGVFERPDESLEDAISRKLEYAVSVTGLKEGDRVLDVGGGWGAFVEYAGARGIRVTSLTISEASRAFIQGIIDAQDLPCEVRREHLFAHRPEAPYDAIVNLGVTEHLPDYPRTIATYEQLLKPGGRVYLDASAARRKNWVSTFVEKQLFPGNGSPLALASYVKAVARSPMELELVINDRVDYGLTARHWAENLDAARDFIEDRFGSRQYRLFRLYLWGCVDGFRRDYIQAYRWVLRKPG